MFLKSSLFNKVDGILTLGILLWNLVYALYYINKVPTVLYVITAKQTLYTTFSIKSNYFLNIPELTYSEDYVLSSVLWRVTR